MKKFLASLLAVSMVAGMAATSFAYEVKDGTPDKDDPSVAFEAMIKEKSGHYYYDDDDGYPIADVLIGPFGYDSEDKNLKTDNSIEFGKTAYYLLTALSLEGADKEKDYTNENKGAADKDDILDAAKVRLITDSNSTSNLKIKEDLEEGKDLIKGIAVSKKKINDVGYLEQKPALILMTNLFMLIKRWNSLRSMALKRASTTT